MRICSCHMCCSVKKVRLEVRNSLVLVFKLSSCRNEFGYW